MFPHLFPRFIVTTLEYRQRSLTVNHGSARTAAALFEPQLHQTVGDGFVLRGFERETIEVTTATFEQL